ncbi:MAG: hypothetical protein H6657_13070 [Ardenticatenaceae bacterium]|nr:hypothetical protein [Anaerolineales bacterium]MCB8978349.1 hypothetical protein [Ardenticatenaceae bacterium]
MSNQYVFPFGQPVLPISQSDRSRKRVFVLGVYASAVHARWVDPNGRTIITALAVASEPSIFWRGEGANALIAEIVVPNEVGNLEPASATLNGPSGRALDECFLHPLGLSRNQTWLCDLVPHSCMNDRQATAIENKYMPLVERGLVPKPHWPRVPNQLANPSRVLEIERELLDSGAEVIITLGDQPLRWFTQRYGSRVRLATYGKGEQEYGQLHPIEVQGKQLKVLPLVHPRHAAGLGGHSPVWRKIHQSWVKKVAPEILGW